MGDWQRVGSGWHQKFDAHPSADELWIKAELCLCPEQDISRHMSQPFPAQSPQALQAATISPPPAASV